MNDLEILAIAEDLARQAAAAILAVRAKGFETNHKSDESPVTEADHAAEAIIVRGLRAQLPHIPVVAEEEVAAGTVTIIGDEFWLVDPLDGTREFAAGRDDFAVCIGLIRNGKPALGVVAVPARGTIYTGINGLGAWKDGPNGRHEITTREVPAEGLAVVASRHYAGDPKTAELLATRNVAELVNIGSAMKFCLVAEGRADFYPRLGRTMEWDTAAPQAVVEAAGGLVTNLDGTPLTYGKPGFENPHFYCGGTIASLS